MDATPITLAIDERVHASAAANGEPVCCVERAATPALAIRGAIVDTADVLYDATLWRRRLLRLIARLGVSAGYDELFAAWERSYLVDVHCGRREYSEAFGAFLLSLGLSWAQIDEVEAASRLEQQSAELGVRPLPGVVKTLSRLVEQGIALVAWADAPYPAAAVAERLGRLGLAGAFGEVLSSFDLEATQPAPCCYEAALAALGLAADQAAYIGHDADHLAGAKAAGLQTVAFNYQPHSAADFYLGRFEDLLALVDGQDASSLRFPELTATPRAVRAEPVTQGLLG